MTTKIFVCTHKPTILPSEDSVFVPLQVGAASNGRFGILSDDTGENISAKNCYYGELTGIYWIWRNYTDADIVGICHYRRFFLKEDRSLMLAEDFEKALEDCDMLLSNEQRSDVSYKEGFATAHRIKYLEQTGEVIKELYPEDYPAFLENLESNVTHFGNLSVMRKELFNDYCEWLFSIFDELEKIVDLSGLDDYHKRLYGFLSEGLLSVYARARGLKIKSGNIGFTEEKSETRELKLALTQLVRAGKFSEARSFYYEILKIRPDIRLEHSDILGELPDMELILYILEEERKAEIKGLYDISHEMSELVGYIREARKLIKAGTYNSTQDYKLSAIAEEIIRINL